MILPNDVSRCDGLLPKLTQLDGKPMILWANDCPKREQCARYCQMERDGDWIPGRLIPYTSHHHAPGDECPDFMPDTVEQQNTP